MKEAPNNLTSKAKIRITDALCEGEIDSFYDGNDDYGPLKSTYLNDVPLMNQNGTLNYNITGDYNYEYTLGTPTQSALSDYSRVENFLPLSNNTELKQLVETPVGDVDYKDVIIAFNNRTYPDAETLRLSVKVPQLFAQIDPMIPDPNNPGKFITDTSREPQINQHVVRFIVQVSTNGGAWTQLGEEIEIKGKTTSGYSHTIDFPLPSDGENFIAWKVRVRRTTMNTPSFKIADAIFVESASVISANQYTYPNTVVVGMEIDSEKFGTIPARKYKVKGLKVKIPDNYDPVTRQYTGIWLGNWKAGAAAAPVTINNPDFNSSTTGWTAFRSTLSTSSSSPPGAYTNYGVVTVNTGAAATDPIQKTYFSAYQSPALPGGKLYTVSGWYKTSSSAISFKVGINNASIHQYYNVGNATTWTQFSVDVRSSSYAAGDWVEFAGVRVGECLAGDAINFTGIQVSAVATTGKEYTNNPAFIFYDICTNPRYGLGSFLQESLIDKFTLYQIAQYCDELVDDGKGGQEPRFTCNVVINRQEDAYRVLLNLVSVFRGMLYFTNGRIFPVQDALKTFVYQFTNANVIDGLFNYGSSSKKNRHTVCKVRWSDPDNYYREAIETVEDIDAISRYGYQEMELNAFGCTSQGQAYRAGKWALVSEALETETVTFKTAAEGAYLRPGDIFQVFDNERYAVNAPSDQGGRLISVTSESGFVLDRPVVMTPDKSYNFTLITSRYYLEATGDITGSDQVGAIRNSQVTTRPVFLSPFGHTGNEITTQTAMAASYGPGSIWTLTANSDTENISTLKPKQYRCLAVSEFSPMQIEVLGLEYSSGKFGLIETGFSVVNNQVYEDTPTAPPAPGGFNVGGYQIMGVDYVVGEQQGFLRDFFQLDWYPVDSPLLKYYRVRLTPPGGSPTIITDTTADRYAYSLNGCRPTGFYAFSVTSVGKGLAESAALTGGYTITKNLGIGGLSFDRPTPITGSYASQYDYEWLNSGFETRAPKLNLLRNTGVYDGSDPRFYYITGYDFDILAINSDTVLLDGGPQAAEYLQLDSDDITAIGNVREFRLRATPLTCIGDGINGFQPYTGVFTNKPPRNSVSSAFTAAADGISYNIIPNTLDTDISGVYIWAKTNTSPPTFSDTPNIISESLNGQVILGTTGSYYLFHSLVDSYTTNGCTIQGPSSVVHYRGATATSLADGAIDRYSLFFSGIQPIEVVSTLPVCNTRPEGAVVFYTVDKKLYRNNGSGGGGTSCWERKIQGDLDIQAGSITSDIISGGAIIAGLVAADAISGNNIRAGSVTADKMFVTYLSGITANLGSITGGEITLANGNLYQQVRIAPGTLQQGLFSIQENSSATLAQINNALGSTSISLLGGGSFSARLTSAKNIYSSFALFSDASSIFYSGLTVSTNPLTVNSTAEFNSTVDFDGNTFFNAVSQFGQDVNFNDLTNFNATATFNSPADFNSTTNFDAAATFNQDIYANDDIWVGSSSSNKSVVLINNSASVFFGQATDNNVYLRRDGTNQAIITIADLKAPAFTVTSSQRYKENIKQIKNSLEIINNLTGVTFDWNNRDKNNDIGFIAEQVEKVLPQIVGHDDKGRPDSVDYARVTAVLVESVKELNQRLKSLEKKIEYLQNSSKSV